MFVCVSVFCFNGLNRVFRKGPTVIKQFFLEKNLRVTKFENLFNSTRTPVLLKKFDLVHVLFIYFFF